MTNALTPELYWTVLTAGLASVLWIPYILQRILRTGADRGLPRSAA